VWRLDPVLVFKFFVEETRIRVFFVSVVSFLIPSSWTYSLSGVIFLFFPRRSSRRYCCLLSSFIFLLRSSLGGYQEPVNLWISLVSFMKSREIFIMSPFTLLLCYPLSPSFRAEGSPTNSLSHFFRSVLKRIPFRSLPMCRPSQDSFRNDRHIAPLSPLHRTFLGINLRAHDNNSSPPFSRPDAYLVLCRFSSSFTAF